MDEKKYIGLNVHQASISVAVRNAAGKLINESVIETKPTSILEFIQGIRGSVWITFEEGTSAAWLSAIVVSLGSAVLSIRQSNIANESAAVATYERTFNLVMKLDQVHLDHPEVRPYFYQDRPLDQDDPNANLVHAIAEMTLDQFSIILTQVSSNPNRYVDIRGYKAWMIDSFKHSRILREYVDDHAR